VKTVNAYKKNQRDLNIWVGENHATPQGNYLAINLNAEIKFQNFIVLSLLLSLRMWVPMCKVLLCCFASLVEMFSEGR
jgi:hypothetical protein